LHGVDFKEELSGRPFNECDQKGSNGRREHVCVEQEKSEQSGKEERDEEVVKKGNQRECFKVKENQRKGEG
jgi:hypothetical protein